MNRLRSPLLIDAVLLFALCTLALSGFHTTFTGWTYLIAGASGLALGIALAALAARLQQPLIVLAVFVVATFFLLGGAVALHGSGGTALLPVPDTLARLADSSINGWKELLTTLPPVDGGPLLALPYLLGLVSGAGGLTLAVRLRSPLAPVLVPITLLAAVILLGVESPQRVVPLAGATSLLAVTWVVLRAHRLRLTRLSGRRLVRQATAAGLCLGAVAVGLSVGPHLPGLGPDRLVLRSHVEPPFDVGRYPSPLASFRRYTEGYTPRARRLYDAPLFSVSGLPEGTVVRIATLDSYDGYVWGAANDAGTATGVADTFQKVGTVIANPLHGTSVTATVTIDKGYGGVWLPTAGSLTGIDFSEPSGEDAMDSFRYNLATDTGVYPPSLVEGDRYTFEAVLPDDGLTDDDVAWSGSSTDLASAARFQQLAAQWGGAADAAMAQVRAVAAHLKTNGRYTDGDDGGPFFPAGHSLRRLTDFVAPDRQLAGNDEQFSALMAILANQLGVPARVVMGAEVPPGGVVKGSDVHAWVELRVADGSWRTLPTSAFMSTDPPDDETPQPQDLVAGEVIPPPNPIRPPSTVGDPVTDSLNQRGQSRDQHDPILSGWVGTAVKYVGSTIALVVLICSAIVGLKALRRRRRRSRGTPVRRLALAWREVVDHARDFGAQAPTAATRREQARALEQAGVGGVGVVARSTDLQMFRAAEPTDDDVAALWVEVDAIRAEIARSRGRWARLRAALNLTTLRPGRRS